MAIDFNKIRKGAAQSLNSGNFQASESVQETTETENVCLKKQDVDTDKIYELGCKYYFGQDGYEENNEKAYQYFKQGSDLGDLWASGMLGRMYMYGHYVTKDINIAKSLLTPSANENIAFAQNCLGDICADEDNDYSAAFHWYSASADSGNSYGLYKTGLLYYCGAGVEENEDKALTFLLKAAELEYDISYFHIGRIYANKEDFKKAFEWFKKSADAGYYSGMSGLGKLYYFGDGVECDNSEAYKWLSQAAEGENAEACFFMGHMYEFGNGVSANHSKAMSYYKKAAELNDERGQMAVQYNGWANVPDDNSSSYDETVASRVKAIIADKLGVEEYELTDNARFTSDLGADSLDSVELIMEFEKKFNITIPEDESVGIYTVGDAIRAIQSRI